jgi:hypothetical protein
MAYLLVKSMLRVYVTQSVLLSNCFLLFFSFSFTFFFFCTQFIKWELLKKTLKKALNID